MGVLAQGGGVPARGVLYLPGVGVPAQGGGVPDRGVYLPRKGVYLSGGLYVCRGCTCLGGSVTVWGMYLPRGYLPLVRGVPAQVLPPVNRMADTQV